VWGTLLAVMALGGSAEVCLAQDIPVEVRQGWAVIARVNVDGAGKLAFLVDTGSGRTVVDKRAAKSLKRVPTTAMVQLPDTAVPAAEVELQSVALGPRRIGPVTVLVEDLAMLGRNLGTRIDGILGMDLLGLSGFSIDYRSKKLQIGAVPMLRWVVPLEGDMLNPAVQVEVGRHSLRLIADTGCPTLLLFRNSLPEHFLHRGAAVSVWWSSSSRLQTEQVLFPRSRVGTKDLNQQVAYTLDSAIDSAQGFLGLAVLHPKRVAFNFQARLLSWE